MPFVIDIEKIKSLIKQNNLKPPALLNNLIDVDYASIHRLLNNKTKQGHRLHMAVRLAKAFNVPIEEIIKQEN